LRFLIQWASVSLWHFLSGLSFHRSLPFCTLSARSPDGCFVVWGFYKGGVNDFALNERETLTVKVFTELREQCINDVSLAKDVLHVPLSIRYVLMAKAEYVSHKEFGTQVCAFLLSCVTRLPLASSLCILGSFIILVVLLLSDKTTFCKFLSLLMSL